MIKTVLRKALKAVLPLLPRGRHRLANAIGIRLAPDPPVEVIDINGLKVEIDHRISTCRHIYYGVYEEAFVHFLRRTLKPGDTFFDLGANIGYLSAVALGSVRPHGRVLAFEPSRICYGQLMRNNPVLPRDLLLLNAAIMHKSGTFPFCDTPRVITKGFSRLHHKGEVQPGDQLYDVDAVSLDDAARDHGVERIRCIKMDIEGAEVIALQGAKGLLADHRVEHVMIETTNYNQAHRAVNEQLIKIMEGHGYQPFLPDRSGRLHPYRIDLSTGFRVDIIWRTR